MPFAARLFDLHACPVAPPPHGVGLITGPCYQPVLIGGMPAARVGDLIHCGGMIALGSMTVVIGGQPAARMGDPTIHGGTIITGFPTVLIG